jgi:periplasmic divalent cation tolerance protein
MDLPNTAVCVLVTMPDRDQALAMARVLVGERLCACVNVTGEIRSVYRWKDAVQDDPEVLCVIKTTRAGFEALRARVVSLHPYEVPEVIALPVEVGHAPYLEWLAASVT